VGREPRSYSIWGRISPAAAGQFVVTVTVMTTDRIGPDELLGESVTVSSHEEARAQRLEMVRAVCSRLEAQGNRISNVEMLD
jgi:hypothetical protein